MVQCRGRGWVRCSNSIVYDYHFSSLGFETPKNHGNVVFIEGAATFTWHIFSISKVTLRSLRTIHLVTDCCLSALQQLICRACLQTEDGHHHGVLLMDALRFSLAFVELLKAPTWGWGMYCGSLLPWMVWLQLNVDKWADTHATLSLSVKKVATDIWVWPQTCLQTWTINFSCAVILIYILPRQVRH